jgi:8-oxo-dGTP pyrophosphatase MutT (NUDIX family)
VIEVRDTLRIVEGFDADADGLAQKSRSLVLDMLTHTAAPFSRTQFTPGHITCTALVLHPREERVLFMHHHRLERWLLPGGHVEEADESLDAAAAREAAEETCIRLDPARAPVLAGIDVHGIPPRKDEPFHLHHDLIWCFRAASDEIAITAEAPRVTWAAEADWDSLGVAESIRQSIRRVRVEKARR